MIAALEGRPVQALELGKPGCTWMTGAWDLLDSRRLYRPAPTLVKIRYRRCVRKSGDHFYVDTVNIAPEGVLLGMYRDPLLMEAGDTFVKWLDDDWVDAEVEMTA